MVVRPPPFHCTIEQGTKLLPLTLRVNPAVPAVALAGDKIVIAGAGRDAAGVPTVKAAAAEFTA